jgi:hypothetical protein
VDIFSNLINFLICWNYQLIGSKISISIQSVQISKSEKLRKYIKELCREYVEKVSNDIPEVADTTFEISKLQNNKNSDYTDIKSKFKSICKTVDQSNFIYINKDKFKKLMNELKFKKFGLEIEYDIKIEDQVINRKVSLIKFNHSLFLCPYPEDLISLM